MMVFLIFLLGTAVQDLKSRTIGIGSYVLGGFAGILWIFYREADLISVLMAMIPGVLLLITGRITGGALGEGDGLFFVIAGFYLTFREVMGLLLSGIFLSGISGILIMASGIIRKKDYKNITIPFLPFLIPGGIWLVFS